ncbi:putative vacuolar protein sorting-associated protein 13F [Bienertia sinuspersici]
MQYCSFMQLDLGQLQIRNEFSWHGCPDDDPSAVHLDVLRAEILGINLSVGIDGCLGRPMMREGHGLVICVRRSLRDVFRKVPTHSRSSVLPVDSLHGVMSDREYNVILNCAYTNLSEEPRLPPSFRTSKSDSQDAMKMLVNRVNANSQQFLSRTVSIVAVEINYALLELCNGIHEESTLAHISLEGLWVSYRMTSLSEADLYVTIPKFSIVDARPDAKPEMRIFVPSLRTITGREELMDPNNDPIRKNHSISLRCAVYKQEEEVIQLSPSRQLIADAPGVDDYLYDGCGRTICLNRDTNLKEIHLSRCQPIIIIGRGKRLRFVNVKIQNGSLLSKYTYLSNDSSYSASPEDGVDISFQDNDLSAKNNLDSMDESSCASDSTCQDGVLKSVQSFTFEAQVRFVMLLYAGVRHVSLLSFSRVVVAKLFPRYPTTGGMVAVVVGPDDEGGVVKLAARDGTMEAYSVDEFGLVVSPELTFYDGTKSSLDDSPYSEKLVRAKFDLSFMEQSYGREKTIISATRMEEKRLVYHFLGTSFTCLTDEFYWVYNFFFLRYASQEDGTWIRALLKDLTVEAGSGLVVLNPVDVLGGYTSVKDKTNMSLSSTDIHLHLSLSVISLLLNLQNQVSGALQFGDANPLATCTNFERLWVSPTENGRQCNLTFWRPRAPSNYVILGDCVTSRSIPPSQAMMAVCNAYGRVRKPLGFNLIGMLSEILQINRTEDAVDSKCECSLWFPVAPPGYTALGCVVNVGDQPPPNHIVYCIRNDLVTSAAYSECLFNMPSNPCFTSGFSIWRLDNVLGSFYAHPSVDYPSKETCYDVIPCLKWRSTGIILQLHALPQSLAMMMNLQFLREVSQIQAPVDGTLEPPTLGIIFLADNPEISAKPVKFTKVAHILAKGVDEAFFWYPIAPPGYASMGCIVTRTDEPPRVESFCCPRIDLVGSASIIEVPIARSSSLKASQCWSLWKVENQASTFLARSDLKKPSSRLALSIGDFAKPKARENVTSEMKVACLSVTIVDSLGGMMTPFFDMTFTNIKLVAHGRFEVMSSVLICSMAASTFNTQLEAWEPLVEPFDGIFKFDTYDTSTHQTPGLGKTLRIAATTILNLNVSAANVDTFAEAVVSWKRQRELEQKAAKLNEVSILHQRGKDDSTLSALDEDDFQNIVVENKLGCDIYVKKLEQDNTVEIVHDNSSTIVWLPPPRFPNRLNVADRNGEARYYIAVRVIEAKDIPIIDDGNSHNFFCALRLVVDNPPTDQQKFFPQSARTKCVRPLITEALDGDVGIAKWDELFIFEVPQKEFWMVVIEVDWVVVYEVGSVVFGVGGVAFELCGCLFLEYMGGFRLNGGRVVYEVLQGGMVLGLDGFGQNVGGLQGWGGTAKLELEITNLAAKAGKGEVVGASSFPVGHGASTLTKIASSRMLHQQQPFKHVASHPLRRRDQEENDGDMMDIGSLLVSTTYFERKLVVDLQKDTTNMNEVESDVGFWIALRSDGPWESCRSFLPLSVFPKSIEDNLLATEVITRNGKKHAIFRGLATVSNETNVKLDLSVCPLSIIDTRTGDARKEIDNISTLEPGSSYNLPWRCISRDSEECLRVRPRFDLSGLSYSWGLSATLGSATYGVVGLWRRRLRVSIERDLGGTDAAPKTIRLSVPYWIVNDSSLPLAYRVVEMEPVDKGDSSILRSAKSSVPRKNVQVLDVIADTSPTLACSHPKITLDVVVFISSHLGRVDVKAFSSDGSYYKLSAQLNMASDGTKVIRFQPRTLYINRIGFSVYIQQCGTTSVEHIRPTDPSKAIQWHSSSEVEMLKLRVDGYKWSRPFSVGSEGIMSIVLEGDSGGMEMIIRVLVRSSTCNSRYEVIFRPNSLSSPYRSDSIPSTILISILES